MTKKLTHKTSYDEQFEKYDELLNRKLEAIEYQLARCKEICENYALMYKQVERKLKVLEDRQNNIQAVYDYMMKVGSSLVKPNEAGSAHLMPNDDPKRLK